MKIVNFSDQASETARTNADLLRRCAAGDEGAWKDLVRRYDRLVHSIVVNEGYSVETADDMTQYAFGQLLIHLDSISNPEHLASWLATVARREAWRLQRRTITTVNLNESLEVADTDADFAERHALKLQINEAVQALPEPCRTLILDLFFDPNEPDYATIAHALDRPVGSVGPMRARCLDKLRALIENEQSRD